MNSMNDGDTFTGSRRHQSASVLGNIDQYKLIRELGGGGFGTVYLAQDTVSGVEVAVKGLPPFVRNNREEMDNIRANFNLVHDIHHPHIAAALYLHPAENVSYSSEDVRQKLRVLSGDTLLVMAYAPGVTLSQWRKQFPASKVPLERAVEITRQIASALDYAHERRVLHRDVKPANVMIETDLDGRVTARVLDFGLAAEIRSSMGRVSQEIHDTSGTRPYMAPEQWLGSRQGPATDQYSLAVLFYELITGEVPFVSVFTTGDPLVMMNVVGTRPPDIPKSLPKHVRLALVKALAKKPEERFSTCMEFIDSLQDIRGKRTDSGMAAAAGRWIPATVVSSVVALLLGLGWWRYDCAVKARLAEEERVKMEAYELRGKASQAREANQKSQWRQWRHFEIPAKELEGAFRAGDLAFEKNDFRVAKVQYLKVRDIWYRLSSNKVDRVGAESQRREMERIRSAAEAVRAGTLAVAEAADAESKRKSAEELFEAGEFVKAGGAFKEAAEAFERSRETAARETRRLAEEKMKADTKAALAAFESKPPRREEGFKYAQTSDKNDPKIQFYLGYCFANGEGGAVKDLPAAFSWYLKSAEQGLASAQFNLALMYDNGRGVEKNDAEAVKWYLKAAEQGDASSQYNLAVSYASGKGTEKDDVAAVKWYRKAADQNYASAQCNLGFMYESGRGVDKDSTEAVKWYRKSAEQGDMTAQCNLGFMYEKGMGVAKDIEKAKSWYRKSAAQGNSRAKKRLEIVTVDKGYTEGLRLTGMDVESPFRNGTTIYISPGDDAKKKIDESPNGATIVFRKGSYKFGNIYLKGNKRIRGESMEETRIEGVFNCSGAGHLTIIENMFIKQPASESLKYPIWINECAKFVVKNCHLSGGGIRVSASAMGIISGVTVENTSDWGLSINEKAKVYVSKTNVSSSNNALIMFTNSRVVVKDSRLERTSSLGNAVGARHGSSLFYIENTVISGGDDCISIGKEDGGCLKNVRFENCRDSIDNDGNIEIYGNTYCGNRFGNSSDGSYTEKENGNFGVREDIFR